jgi:hypothetical protein
MAVPLRATQVPGDLHLGFWTALGQVWGDTEAPPPVWPANPASGSRSSVPDCVREFQDAQHPKLVWITGHSLGGALATMAAARLVGEGVLRPEQIGGIYTFGQPRVGDAHFAQAYALGARHFRVVHDNDVVTQVPPEGLRQAHAVVRLFLDDRRDTSGAIAAAGSRFQYRHVGRVVFVSRRVGVTPDITPMALLWRRLVARVDALFRAAPVRDRLFPGLSDHSMANYTGLLEAGGPLAARRAAPVAPSRANTSTVSDSEASRRASLLAAVGGAGAGLIAGLLAGVTGPSELVAAGGMMAGRLTAVGTCVGGVAAGLAALLALDDRHLTSARSIAAGAFGVVSVVGLLVGTYIRSY